MTIDPRAERAYGEMTHGEQRNVRKTLTLLAEGKQNLKWSPYRQSHGSSVLGVDRCWTLRASREWRMFFDRLPGDNAEVTLLMIAARNDRRFYNDERGGGFS